MWWDMGFLAFGAALLVAGLAVWRGGRPSARRAP
jgi:hypothetical protein